MNFIKQQLIEEAFQKHHDIFPCSNKNDLEECFTVEDDLVIFWFNTSDKSTHILSANF